MSVKISFSVSMYHWQSLRKHVLVPMNMNMTVFTSYVAKCSPNLVVPSVCNVVKPSTSDKLRSMVNTIHLAFCQVDVIGGWLWMVLVDGIGGWLSVNNSPTYNSKSSAWCPLTCHFSHIFYVLGPFPPMYNDV